jgi:hypothetical protein
MAKLVYPESIETRALEYKNTGHSAQETLYGLQADYPELMSQIRLENDSVLPPLTPKGQPLSGVGIAADALAQALEKVYMKGREDVQQDIKIEQQEQRIEELEAQQMALEAMARAALSGQVNHLQQHQALEDGTIKKLSPADSLMAIIAELEGAGVDPQSVIASLPSGAKSFAEKRLKGLPTTKADEQALEDEQEEYDDAGELQQPVRVKAR